MSAFPKSYLLNRGLNPFKRLKNCYVFSNTDSAEGASVNDAGGESDGTTYGGRNEFRSEISAVTFYNDNVTVYDKGISFSFFCF